MTDEDLDKLATVARRLYKLKEELARYKSERYLNDEKMNPWITVSVGNHPTYLREFTLKIFDPEARVKIKELMLAEIKHRIRSLEVKLRHLKGKK